MKEPGFFSLSSWYAILLCVLLSLPSRAQYTPPGPPTKLLSVDITSPTNGEVFPAPSDIQIDLSIKSYNQYVRWVAVYSGTNRLFYDLVDPAGPWQTNGTAWGAQFHWTNVQAGTYTLIAVITNVIGNSATSTPVTITVGAKPPPTPVVTIVATDPIASMVTNDTGTFTVYRTGNTSNALDVFYSISGTASNGIDYQPLGTSVTIPAGSSSADITVIPIKGPLPDRSETIKLQLTPSPLASPLPTYNIGALSNAVVTILATNSLPPIVTIVATDPIAIEPGTNRVIFYRPVTPFTNYYSGTNTATFLVRRIGSPLMRPTPATNDDLTVYYNISGTATNGVNYVTLPGFVTIPSGKTYALITINPLEDNDPSNTPPYSTVILSLTVPPTVTNAPSPYTLGIPSKAGAVILEERLYYPIGFPIHPLASAGFNASWPAVNGMNYCIQVSSNLVDWLPVCTNTVVKSAIDFVDPDAATLPTRYYRAVPAPGMPAY